MEAPATAIAENQRSDSSARLALVAGILCLRFTVRRRVVLGIVELTGFLFCLIGV